MTKLPPEPVSASVARQFVRRGLVGSRFVSIADAAAAVTDELVTNGILHGRTELRLTVRALPAIERRSWKNLLSQVKEKVQLFGARGVVLGLPLNLDGTEGEAAAQAREVAEKFRLSLDIPVYLEDERLTSREAEERLSARERDWRRRKTRVDALAAAIILQDYLDSQPRRVAAEECDTL